MRNLDSIDSGWVKRDAFVLDTQNLSSSGTALVDAGEGSEAALLPCVATIARAPLLSPSPGIARKREAYAAGELRSEVEASPHSRYHARSGGDVTPPAHIPRNRGILPSGGLPSGSDNNQGASPSSPEVDSKIGSSHSEASSPAKTPISSMLRRLQEASTVLTDRQRHGSDMSPLHIPRAQWRTSPKFTQKCDASTSDKSQICQGTPGCGSVEQESPAHDAVDQGKAL